MSVSLQKQKGFLAIIAALLIVTVGFMSLVVSYVYGDKATSVQKALSAMQSYYIALGGIENLIYNYTILNSNCTQFNNQLSFPGFMNGQTLTTATLTAASTVISQAVTGTDNVIYLASPTGFAVSGGTVIIDAEYINYTAVTGSTLVGLTRGVGGSTATAHSMTPSPAAVGQNQCFFTITGAIPLIQSPKTISQRKINGTLVGSGFSIGQSSTGAGHSPGSSNGLVGPTVISSALMSNQQITIPGGTGSAKIINPTVITGSPNFPGSTILSFGAVTLTGNAITQVSDGAGNLVTSSIAGSNQSDIYSPSTSPFTGAYFTNFFSSSKATVENSATYFSTCSTLYNSNGQVWTNTKTGQAPPANPLICAGGGPIGTPSNPVILIIDGNVTVNINAATTINGFVFVNGNLVLNAPLFINGGLAINGVNAITNNNTNLTVIYNPGILAGAAALTLFAHNIYFFVPASVQEQFS